MSREPDGLVRERRRGLARVPTAVWLVLVAAALVVGVIVMRVATNAALEAMRPARSNEAHAMADAGAERGARPTYTVNTHAPRASGGGARVQGSLPRDVIERVVEHHLAEVRACYLRVLEVRPRLEGRVMTRFIISPTGTVLRAEVSSAQMASPQLEACLVGVIERWSFPRTPGGGLAVVDYPFILENGR